MARTTEAATNNGDGAESILGRGTRVRGRIRGDGDLRVEGAIEGDVAEGIPGRAEAGGGSGHGEGKDGGRLPDCNLFYVHVHGPVDVDGPVDVHGLRARARARARRYVHVDESRRRARSSCTSQTDDLCRTSTPRTR